MCKTLIPERRRQPQQKSSNAHNRYSNSFTPRSTNNQTQRVHHIEDGTDQDVTQNSEGDSHQAEEVNAEAAPHTKELTEDWPM